MGSGSPTIFVCPHAARQASNTHDLISLLRAGRSRHFKGDAIVTLRGFADYDDHEAVDALLAPAAGVNFAQRVLAKAASPPVDACHRPCSKANGSLCAQPDGVCVLQREWTASMTQDAASYTLTFTRRVSVAPTDDTSRGAAANTALSANSIDRWISVCVDRQTGVCHLEFGGVNGRNAPFSDAWKEELKQCVGIPVTLLPVTWIRSGIPEVAASKVPLRVEDALVLFGVASLESMLVFMLRTLAHARECPGVLSPTLYDPDTPTMLRVSTPLEYYGYGVDHKTVVGLAETRLVRVAGNPSRVTLAATLRRAQCTVFEPVPSGKVNKRTAERGSGSCGCCSHWGNSTLTKATSRLNERLSNTTPMALPSGEVLQVPVSDAPSVVSEVMGVRATEVRVLHTCMQLCLLLQ